MSFTVTAPAQRSLIHYELIFLNVEWHMGTGVSAQLAYWSASDWTEVPYVPETRKSSGLCQGLLLCVGAYHQYSGHSSQLRLGLYLTVAPDPHALKVSQR